MFVQVKTAKVFYREAGDKANPVLLLLHGFPTSSHMFRNMLPILSQKYYVVAPDLPGFGFTEPAPDYVYSFESLSTTIGQFLDALSIAKFAVYIFDYGAPTGLRLALSRPHAITALITQNGNAYTEGLGDAWAPVKKYWATGADEDRKIVGDALLSYDATKFQYVHGESDPDSIAPESYTLDYALLQRPGNRDIQLDLFKDYENNVNLYPQFQQWLRDSQVPTLAVWGKNDPFFIPPGAEAYKRDLKTIEVKLLDAGHFAGESHATEIAKLIINWASKL